MSYRRFFSSVTGRDPLPYQQRLAQSAWPEIIDVPTGLGKTAAIVVAWLWKRLQQDPQTGRRLVYCLPMHVSVQQTASAGRAWSERAEAEYCGRGLAAPSVYVVTGGDQDGSWEATPESPAIIVGTQDMLLSRALNRGFGMELYRWPLHFAMLNNDCLWVVDETQVMGVAVETSAQLQAFRMSMGAVGPSHTVWMSAAPDQQQLATVDHPRPAGGWKRVALDAADHDNHVVTKRITAAKPMRRSGLRLSARTESGFPEDLAKELSALHQKRGRLTLAIVNRVQRAQRVYAALKELRGDAGGLALVHSRFRPPDQHRHLALLTSAQDRIVVATQAVEVGVDVSAHTLVTELAPWPSMVQRFGRCNRDGKDQDAEISWVDVDPSGDNGAGLALPYDVAELATARLLLDSVSSASPAVLGEIEHEPPAAIRPVVRRRDLLELFDTTPDLLGHDVDVSRYVRDGHDADVQVFWRDFDGRPPDDTPRAHADELCRVAVRTATEWAKRLRKRAGPRGAGQLWEWDHIAGTWRPVRLVRPGQILLLPSTAGGYDPELGWTGDDGRPVPEIAHETAAPESTGADPDTALDHGLWIELQTHSRHVETETRRVAEDLGIDISWVDAVATAGQWHDVGKAHPEFQARLVEPVKGDPERQPPRDALWAKSGHRERSGGSQRRYFRHELASALAWLAHGQTKCGHDLVGYLIAAHHGKVRLSIRSLPGEPTPDDPSRLFAHGVWDGDRLAAFTLPDGTLLENAVLDLSAMQLGRGSWLERMLALRDDPVLGPFRLAMLETILRAADWRATRKEEEREYDDV